MLTDPLRDSMHHRHFGHPVLAESLAERIRRHFAAPERVRPVEKALVIGVFGEWGSGKSTVLDAVGRLFACTPDQVAESTRSRAGTPAPLTVPIAFNPWRFEKEAHLIVPLLKTVEVVLQQLAMQVPDATEPLADRLNAPLQAPDTRPTLRERLRRFGRSIGNAVVGIASALEGTAEIPLPNGGKLSVKCSPKAFVDVFRQGQAIDAATEDPLSGAFAAAESMYFDFPLQLQRLTDGDAETASLNLLFLIDDLDRCLPDKAVDLLESIKLFFDVPRCAFLLALDDEVIERGVMHRYRDYFGKADAQAHLPLTGAEYLEKIIHLPVRLPMLNRAEVEGFLLEHYPGLFNHQTGLPASTKVDELREASGSRPLAVLPGGDVLLDLYLSAVPRLPRKLQRAAELLEMTLAVAKARNLDVDAVSMRVTLARLVILQLFAPDLYRFGRRQVSFLARLQEWHDDDRCRKLMFLESDEELLNLCTAAKKESQQLSDFYASDPLQKQDEMRLRHLMVAACRARTGFHIRDLLNPRFRGGGVEEVRFCFELFMPASVARSVSPEKSAAVVDTGTSAPSASNPYGRVENPDRFLSYILAPTEAGWQQAVSGELEGGAIPEVVFEKLLAVVGTDDHPMSMSPEWLRVLLPVLTKEQAMRLYGKFNIETSCLVFIGESSQSTPCPCALSQNGRFILTGAGIQAVRLWDVASGREVQHFVGHDGDVWACALAPDGQRVLTGSSVSTAWLWDVASGREVQCLGHEGGVLACAFAPDGQRVLTGSRDCIARLWDVASGLEVQRFIGHREDVCNCAFAPDGRRVLTGSRDGTARLWDAVSGQEMQCIPLGGMFSDWRAACAFAPDGQRVLTGSERGVLLWDAANGQMVRHLARKINVTACAFAPDGQLVLIGLREGGAQLLNAASGREVRQFEHDEAVTACTFMPDGQRVLTSTSDGNARLWSIQSGRCLAVFWNAPDGGWATWWNDPESDPPRHGYVCDPYGRGRQGWVLADPGDRLLRRWYPTDFPNFRLP